MRLARTRKISVLKSPLLHQSRQYHRQFLLLHLFYQSTCTVIRKGLEKSISSPYRANNIVTCELYIHVSSQKLSRRLVVPRK